MTIITYADNFPFLEVSLPMNKRFHEVLVFKDCVPERFKGWPGDFKGTIPFKPDIIKRALAMGIQKLVWMDADAFCVQHIDEMFEQEFDLCFTLRSREEHDLVPQSEKLRYAYINAGVIFIRNTQATRDFVDRWILEVDKTESKSDQEALNNLLLLSGYEWGTFQDLYRARIMTVPTELWNYYRFEFGVPKTAKVLHFKVDKRHYLEPWIASNESICAVLNRTGSANDALESKV